MIDTRAFRDVAGKFPSGVTVITTSGARGDVHGMTANGFASVSLDPPLILVSVAVTGRTHERLTRNERYAVSILGHRQKDVAQRFAHTSAASALARRAGRRAHRTHRTLFARGVPRIGSTSFGAAAELS